MEYEIPDRDGEDELIALVTTITDPLEAPAAAPAAAYHQRWEHETANAQLKTFLRGPGRILRSQSPDMIEQEIWGYLLLDYAISALICTAATSAGIDPGQGGFKRTIRAAPPPGRRPGFSPLIAPRILDRVAEDITSRQNLNQRRERTYPRVVKRPRHNSYHVKKPGDRGQRHNAPPTITLVNLAKPQAAA